MATCAPTAWARAPTVLNWLQSSLAHTTKERRVPTTGGLARGVDAATAGARRAVAAGNRSARPRARSMPSNSVAAARGDARSEEHTSELQSQSNLVCRLLLEKKKRVTVPLIVRDVTKLSLTHLALGPGAW